MAGMSDAPEVLAVANSFQQWLQQGEMLYSTALNEFHALESQLDDLEAKLAAKQAEVNQIAHVIGKPPVEGTRRVSAQIVQPHPVDDFERAHQTSNNATIARALTGKFGR